MGATLFVQPLDLVKNRMQLSGTTGTHFVMHNYNRTSVTRNEVAYHFSRLLDQSSYTFFYYILVYTSPNIASKISKKRKKTGQELFLNSIVYGFVLIWNDAFIQFIMPSSFSGKKEYRSSIHALTSIVRNEGVLAVYNGLSAGLLRQATYTTTRLGTYTYLFEHFRTWVTNSRVDSVLLLCYFPFFQRRGCSFIRHESLTGYDSWSSRISSGHASWTGVDQNDR